VSLGIRPVGKKEMVTWTEKCPKDVRRTVFSEMHMGRISKIVFHHKKLDFATLLGGWQKHA
jgi:hypothetical protein